MLNSNLAGKLLHLIMEIASKLGDSIVQGTEKKNPWKSLLFLNIYRIILALVFLVTYLIRDSNTLLGHHAPRLFLITAIAYLATSIISVIIAKLLWLSYSNFIHILTFIDIGLLSVFMHASGGINSGLGMLLVVAIAASSIISEGRTATLFAAMAAICILAEQFIAQMEGEFASNYTQAGFLGGTLFATAILAHVLSSRLHETEAIALQRGIDLANMAQLNEHVIKHLQSGLIVVDNSNKIRLVNESAWKFLGKPSIAEPNDYLQNVCPAINSQLQDWRSGKMIAPSAIQPEHSNFNVIPGYRDFGEDGESGTLIFLEDASRVSQQAQQMKLASLGRLTASIAHEIRNPLGAISHAEQLLAESVKLDAQDKRLAEIIHKNSERVNAIIENVLQLSRREVSLPETIRLSRCIDNFKQEFISSHSISAEDIVVDIKPDDIRVFFDATQLHQILWNICENGLRYSLANNSHPLLKIIGGRTDTNNSYLEIIDFGCGVPNEHVDNIFEPFFTTEKFGSGLGLYICKELCEANSARISYRYDEHTGSCFRMDFPMQQIFRTSA